MTVLDVTALDPAAVGPATAFGVAVVAILGLAIGSFANVAIARVPAGESVVAPASRCPRCGSGIRPYDNIPVISWLVLRGRCRDCRAPISWRYPVVEAGTAALFILVAVRFVPTVAAASGARASVAALLGTAAFLYLAAISVILAAIDLDTRTLPDRIVLPAYLVGGALVTASALVAGDLGMLVRAAIGLAALWTLYFALALVRPGGMGLGDVKLAGVLGLYLGSLGWGELAVGAFAAFFIGGAIGVALLATRRATRTTGIPFGPWMLAGAWIGVFAGGAAWHGYLSLFGLAG